MPTPRKPGESRREYRKRTEFARKREATIRVERFQWNTLWTELRLSESLSKPRLRCPARVPREDCTEEDRTKPDPAPCGGRLKLRGQGLQCRACGRVYPVPGRAPEGVLGSTRGVSPKVDKLIVEPGEGNPYA